MRAALSRRSPAAHARLSSADAAALLLISTTILIVGFGATVRHAGSWNGGDHASSALAALADGAASHHAAASSGASSHHHHASAGRETCEEALGAPKVALMFLTRAGLYHEAAWAAWLKTAEGIIPHPSLWGPHEAVEGEGGEGVPAPVPAAAACTPASIARLDAACGPSAAAQRAEAGGRAQALFSIYTHAAPDFPGFPAGSVFAGSLIPTRIAASWGGHDLVDVTRALLKAALDDPRNARFALLSESGIPIYPAPVAWAALVANPLSRINACPNPWNDEKRWHPDFGAGGPGVKADGTGAAPLGPPLPQSAWRKSSQWSALTRAHARLVVDDTAVDALFRAICTSRDWDEALQRRYDCYSDEHYIPTLLATHHLDNGTDCMGYYVNVDWSKGGAHPRTYVEGDVAPALFDSLRAAWGDCDPKAATALGRSLFGAPKALLGRRGAGDGCSAAPAAWSLRLLPKECPLFARKFPAETAGAVAAALTDCTAGVIPGEAGCVVGRWDAFQRERQGKHGEEAGEERHPQKEAEGGGGGGGGGGDGK